MRWYATAAYDEHRCTNTVLREFGVCSNQDAISGADVLQVLRDAGYSFRILSEEEIEAQPPRPSRPVRGVPTGNMHMTLAEFVQAYPTGKYVLSTWRHSLALIDGRLVDTEGAGMRRRVQAAAEITGGPAWPEGSNQA